MEDFLGIGIVGVAASLIIEAINLKLGVTSVRAKVLTLAVAIALGTFYFLARDTAWWMTVLGVLGAASTVYAFFLKK